MGEVIWVEILSRHRDVAERHRCEGPEVTIGRGYDNDLVLDDPYVAPRHLRIARDRDGALVAEDLGSVNGLTLEGSDKRLDRVIVDGNQPLMVGHTLLRVRTADFSIVPERRTALQRSFWSWGLATWAALIAVELLEFWLGRITETRVSEYALPILLVSGLMIVWATIWAVLNRIFSGSAHFDRHMLIASAGLLTLSVVIPIVEYIAFAFSWPVLVEYDFVVGWLIFGAVTFLQLRQIGPAHQRIKLVVVCVIVVIAIALPWVGKLETQARYGEQVRLSKLKPSSVRIVSPQSEEAFFAEIEELKKELAQDRIEPPKTGGTFWSFDGDD